MSVEITNNIEVKRKRGRPAKYTSIEESKKSNNQMSLDYYHNIIAPRRQEEKLEKLKEKVDRSKNVKEILEKVKYELKYNDKFYQKTILDNVLTIDLK